MALLVCYVPHPVWCFTAYKSTHLRAPAVPSAPFEKIYRLPKAALPLRGRIFAYTMRHWLILFVLGVLVCACNRGPDFPDNPVIELRELKLMPNLTPSNGALDSMIITIRFTDGNGDLGLTETDRESPIYKKYPNASLLSFASLQQARLTNDLSYFNPRYYNFFLTIFAENIVGRFDTIAGATTLAYQQDAEGNKLDSVPYQDQLSRFGAFAPTEDMNQGEAIEGTIRYKASDFLISIPGATPAQNRGRIVKGRRYFIRVFIVDRSGRVSNKIQSDTLVYNP